MAANHTTTVEVVDSEVVAALEVIRRHARIKNTVQVFIEAGVNQATGYRRLNEPGDIKIEELAAISRTFGVPLHIIAEGELATARWFKEKKPTNPGPDLGVHGSPWNTGRRGQGSATVVPFRAPIAA